MAKKLTGYTRNRNRILRYINKLKKSGYKVELNIPTERQIRESGVTGRELAGLTRELKKIRPETLKSISVKIDKGRSNIMLNNTYSTVVIDNLRSELSKYNTQISGKLNALLNQLIQQQGEESVAYALNKMSESFFTALYRAHFDSDSAVQNFATSLIENLPEASERYKKDLMDAFENEELGYSIED